MRGARASAAAGSWRGARPQPRRGTGPPGGRGRTQSRSSAGNDARLAMARQWSGCSASHLLRHCCHRHSTWQGSQRAKGIQGTNGWGPMARQAPCDGCSPPALESGRLHHYPICGQVRKSSGSLLVSRFRRSYHLAAPAFTNVGKGTLASHDPSVALHLTFL